MNPTLIVGAIAAYFLLKSKATPVTPATAQGTALQKAQAAALQAAQKAATASGGGSGGGSGSGSSAPPSGQLAQFLSNLKGTIKTDNMPVTSTPATSFIPEQVAPDYTPPSDSYALGQLQGVEASASLNNTLDGPWGTTDTWSSGDLTPIAADPYQTPTVTYQPPPDPVASDNTIAPSDTFSSGDVTYDSGSDYTGGDFSGDWSS